MRSLTWYGVALPPLACLLLTCARGPFERAPRERSAYGRYPAGRWRLAPFSEVDGTVLWVSHVVIMHRQSQPGSTDMRPLGWTPDPVPGRSREEARSIAAGLRLRAQAAPQTFAELARTYSDDTISRDWGGSLGGVHAGQLPAAFLDALNVLNPGAVSEVIETSMGFHILLRRSPPPREKIQGSHVVIRYATTLGTGASTRARAEALALSRTVVDLARHGMDFSELVRKYSEAPDAARGGELGIWDTTDPSPTPIVTERLAATRISEVSDPVETRFGFEVLKRVQPGSDVHFGARLIRIPYDPDAIPNTTRFVTNASEEALVVVAQLKKDPSLFSEIQARHGTIGAERWSEGHAAAPLTSLVERLQVGQISTEPIQEGYSFVVAERIDPDLLAPNVPPPTSLPEPAGVDLEAIMRANPPASLSHELSDLQAALENFGIPQSQRALIRDALDQLKKAIQISSNEKERVAAYQQANNLLYRGLSEADYSKIMVAIQQWCAARLLSTMGG